jgi:hypothetical protein
MGEAGLGRKASAPPYTHCDTFYPAPYALDPKVCLRTFVDAASVMLSGGINFAYMNGEQVHLKSRASKPKTRTPKSKTKNPPVSKPQTPASKPKSPPNPSPSNRPL